MNRSSTCSTGAVEQGNYMYRSIERRHLTRHRNAKHTHHDSTGDFQAPKRPVQRELNTNPSRRQSMEQEEHSKDHHRRHNHHHRHHNQHQLRKIIVDGAKLSAKLMAAVVFCAVAPILYVVIPPAHDAGDRA